MLGTANEPRLLVDVSEFRSPTDFDFCVVNGHWNGTFYNGHVTVWTPDNPWTELDKTEILTDNQDRLRGSYHTVFEHFHDLNYVAPKPKEYSIPSNLGYYETGWDDDLPF